MVFSQSSKYIKILYFSSKTRGSSVGKKGASSGFNSRVGYFAADIHDMYRKAYR